MTKLAAMCKKAARAVWTWWDGLPPEDQKKLIQQAGKAAKKIGNKD